MASKVPVRTVEQQIKNTLSIITATANSVFENTDATEVKVEHGGISVTMRRIKKDKKDKKK